MLLELARVTDLTRVAGEVWLVFFDAEDNGGLGGWEYVAGSRIFVSELEITPAYMILVDMIGDADQDIYFEANSDPTLREHLWSVAWDLGYERHFIPVVHHSILDDHAPFLEQGIPAVDIIDWGVSGGCWRSSLRVAHAIHRTDRPSGGLEARFVSCSDRDINE